MKSFYFLLLVFSLSASAKTLPLLAHAYDEGLVPPWMYHVADCQIFPDRILITCDYAGIATEEEHPLKFTGDSLRVLKQTIAKAAEGQVKVSSAPTDLPYDGYLANSEGAPKSVVLKVSESSSVQENQSEAARTLILFIDAHCPKVN